MLDTGSELFVWVGSGASPTERKNSMGYAHVSKTPVYWGEASGCICILKIISIIFRGGGGDGWWVS